MKVAAAVPQVRVADPAHNAARIVEMMARADASGVEIAVFPELSVTGYSCQDLFRQGELLRCADEALRRIMEETAGLGVAGIVGLPVPAGNVLLNCAAVVQAGRLVGLVPKTYLPNYGEFYEKRWFAPSAAIAPQTLRVAGVETSITPGPVVFHTPAGLRFGVEICEDAWAPIPVGAQLATAGADIIFNLSASDELAGKHAYLRGMLLHHSARNICGYVYSGCGYGESTQDMVFGGNAMVMENGKMLAAGERFSMGGQLVAAQIDVELIRAERRGNSTFGCAAPPRAVTIHTPQVAGKPFALERKPNPLPFIPTGEDMDTACGEIFQIQALGLARRLEHTGARSAVVGVSGGLDSTLALLVCCRAFDTLGLPRKGITGITMPGFGTTGRTKGNSEALMEGLGITAMEIPISEAVRRHFADIGHDPGRHDAVYENSQARERTQILMDTANKTGGIVVGTGDLSELALGWATYNGDHMSMYGVNAGVPKTLVRTLIANISSKWGFGCVAGTLADILDTPISPELLPPAEDGGIAQKSEDLVGPYELHDFFLYHFIRFGFSPAKIQMLAERAFDGSDPRAGSYGAETIKRWLSTFVRRFFSQQFKRSCLPDGPKVGSVCLSPRGDWRMPSDASAAVWAGSANG